MKIIIHVNQHHIKWNQKNKDQEKRPVFTVKQGKKNTYAERVVIKGPSEVIYQPDKPLKCGARAWIETKAEVELTNAKSYSDIHREEK